jgi:hypothetical protein
MPPDCNERRRLDQLRGVRRAGYLGAPDSNRLLPRRDKLSSSSNALSINMSIEPPPPPLLDITVTLALAVSLPAAGSNPPGELTRAVSNADPVDVALDSTLISMLAPLASAGRLQVRALAE